LGRLLERRLQTSQLYWIGRALDLLHRIHQQMPSSYECCANFFRSVLNPFLLKQMAGNEFFARRKVGDSQARSSGGQSLRAIRSPQNCSFSASCSDLGPPI
jgi:hypothetical protein